MASFITDIPALLASIEEAQKSVIRIVNNVGTIAMVIDQSKWSIGTSIKTELFFRSFFGAMTSACKDMIDYYNYATRAVPIAKPAMDATEVIVNSSLSMLSKTRELLEVSQEFSSFGVRKAVTIPFEIIYKTIEKTMELSNFILTGKRPGFHLFNKKYDPLMIRKGLLVFTAVSGLLMLAFKMFKSAAMAAIDLGQLKKRKIRKGFKRIKLILSKTIELIDKYFTKLDEREMLSATKKSFYIAGLVIALTAAMHLFASIGLVVGIAANIGVWFANKFTKKLVSLVEHINAIRFNKDSLIQLAICNIAAVLTYGVMTIFGSIGILLGMSARIGAFFAVGTIRSVIKIVELLDKVEKSKALNALAVMKLMSILLLGTGGILAVIAAIGLLTITTNTFINVLLFLLVSVELLSGMVGIIFMLKKMKLAEMIKSIEVLHLIIGGIIVGAAAKGLLWIISEIDNSKITLKTLWKILLFVTASAILLAGMALIISFLRKFKLPKIATASAALATIVTGLIVGLSAKGLMFLISELNNIDITLKTVWKIILFTTASIVLLTGITLIIALLRKFNLPKIASASAALAVIVTGLLVGLGAKGLMYLLVEIDKLPITPMTLLHTLLFCGGALILSLAIFLIVKILGQAPVGAAIKACLIMAVFAGTILLFSWALAAIQDSVKDLELTTILVFAGAVLILTGIVLVMGLVGMVATPVLLGLGVMVLALGAVLLISLELILLAQIDLSTIEKAKENAKLVFSTVMEILFSFAEDIVPKEEKTDSKFTNFLLTIGGAAAMVAIAFASMAFVIISFVTITVVLLIAFELTILGELDMASRKQKIMDNVNIIFGTVKDIYNRINEQMDTMAASDDSELGKLLAAHCPMVAAFVQAIMAFSFVFISLVTMTLVLIMATELRLIQELDLNQELISNNIKIVFDSVNQIIAAVLTPPEKDGEPMEEGALGTIIRLVYPPLASVLNALFTFAYVALSLLTVGGVLLITMALKKIQDIELNPEKIRTNLDAVFTSINAVHAAIMVKRDLKDEGEDKSWFKDLLSNLPGLGTISKIADAISEMGTVATSMIIVGSIASIAESLKKIETITLNAKTVQVNTQNIMNCVDLVWKKLQGWGLEDADKDLFKNMERLMNSVSKLADASIKFSKVDPAKHASATNDIIKLIDKTKTIDVSKLNTVTMMFKQLADFSKSIRGNFDKLADVLNDKLIELLEKLHVTLKEIQESEKTSAEKPVASAPAASTGPVSLTDKAKAVAAKATGAAAAKGAANAPGGKIDLSDIENELKAIARALNTRTFPVSMSSTPSS